MTGGATCWLTDAGNRGTDRAGGRAGGRAGATALTPTQSPLGPRVDLPLMTQEPTFDDLRNAIATAVQNAERELPTLRTAARSPPPRLPLTCARHMPDSAPPSV